MLLVCCFLPTLCAAALLPVPMLRASDYAACRSAAPVADNHAAPRGQRMSVSFS